jgi:hypothetical protein
MIPQSAAGRGFKARDVMQERKKFRESVSDGWEGVLHERFADSVSVGKGRSQDARQRPRSGRIRATCWTGKGFGQDGEWEERGEEREWKGGGRKAGERNDSQYRGSGVLGYVLMESADTTSETGESKASTRESSLLQHRPQLTSGHRHRNRSQSGKPNKPKSKPKIRKRKHTSKPARQRRRLGTTKRRARPR